MSFEHGFTTATEKTAQSISEKLSALEVDLREKNTEYLARLADEIFQKSQKEIEADVRRALRDAQKGPQWFENRRDAQVISVMIMATRQEIVQQVLVPALGEIKRQQAEKNTINVNTQAALQDLQTKVDTIFLAHLDDTANAEQVESVRIRMLYREIDHIRATVPPENQLEALQAFINPEFERFIAPIEADIRSKEITFTDSRPGIIVDFFNAPDAQIAREKLMDFKTLQYLNDYIETAPQRFQRYQNELRRLMRGKTPQDQEQKARGMRYIFADYGFMNIALGAKEKILSDPGLKQAYELANTSGRILEQVRIYLDERSAGKSGPLRELLKKPDGILRFLAFGAGWAWLLAVMGANGVGFLSDPKNNSQAGMVAGAAGALAFNLPRIKTAASGGDRAEGFYDVFLQRFDQSAAASTRRFFLESDPEHLEAQLSELINWKRLRASDFRLQKNSRREWGLAELIQIGENPNLVSPGVEKQEFDAILRQMSSDRERYFAVERNKDRKEVYKEFLGEFTTHEMRHFQEYLRQQRA